MHFNFFIQVLSTQSSVHVTSRTRCAIVTLSTCTSSRGHSRRTTTSWSRANRRISRTCAGEGHVESSLMVHWWFIGSLCIHWGYGGPLIAHWEFIRRKSGSFVMRNLFIYNLSSLGQWHTVRSQKHTQMRLIRMHWLFIGRALRVH